MAESAQLNYSTTDLSPRDRLALMSKDAQLEILGKYSPEELLALQWDWVSWLARPSQKIPSGSWFIWLLMTGRGWGKTRTGAETVRYLVENDKAHMIALVGRTAADARDVMVEGPSGILETSPPWNKPKYVKSERLIQWPNGAYARTYSSEEPRQLRGPEFDFAWMDEPAHYFYPDEVFGNLVRGLRSTKGKPRAILTTTPLPIKLIKDIVDGKRGKVHITTGSSYDNIGNLASTFVENSIRPYEGTREEKQEIYGKLLTKVPGALWNVDLIASTRASEAPPLQRIVVGVDPAVTSTDPDETGIVICGLGQDNHYYVLADFSIRDSPITWARRVRAAYFRYHADVVVAESNNGGELVEQNIRLVHSNIPVVIRTASKGKIPRAEPVSMLFEKGIAHFVGTSMELLEQQCCTYTGKPTRWNPGMIKSPDRMDAMVWAISELAGLTNEHQTQSYQVSAGIEEEITPDIY